MDIMLDMNDKDFAADLAAALDLKPGEELEIVTPQFERTDGRIISYFPKTKREYEALILLSESALKKIGCQKWDGDENEIHWLYPAEWYSSIPDGLKITSISGNAEIFKTGKTDDDRRFGALAFGFIQSK